MPETKNGSTSVHHVRLQMDQSNDERGAISIVTDSYSQETGGVTLAESAGAGLSNGRIASSGRSQPIAEPKRLCDTLRAVGDSDEAGSQGLRLRGNGGDECATRAAGLVGAVEHPQGDGREQRRPESSGRGAASGCGVGGMEHAEQGGFTGRRIDDGGRSETEGRDSPERSIHRESIETRGPTNGFWRDAGWVWCKDGKYRAVERTARGLADEYSRDLGRVRYGDTEITHPLQAKGKARVLRLRGYGDAIVLEQAIAWIRAVMETI